MPTDTPTPTMTPTPVPPPGTNWYWDVQQNAVLATASVWAVLVLFIFVLMVKPQQRTMQAFLTMAVICLPLAILNSSVWAVTMYFYTGLYAVLHLLGRIAD